VFNFSAPVLQNDTREAGSGEGILSRASHRTEADDSALDGTNPAPNQQEVTVPQWTSCDPDHAAAHAMHPARDSNAIGGSRLPA